LLVVPGGSGQEALMEEEHVHGFIRALTAVAEYVFSIRTGFYSAALRHFAPDQGHHPLVCLSLAGILRVASPFRNDSVAQQIQLTIEYAPDPLFNSGTPQTAPRNVLEPVTALFQQITSQRFATAQRIAARLQGLP